MGLRAAFNRDDGASNVPGVDTPWDVWIAASRTRNYCSDDPLLDWLDRYGDAHGFVREDRGPGFDPRTDFREFIFRKGLEFERAVMAHLAQRFQMVTVCQERGAVRERRSVEATFAAMGGAVEIIAQPALWNAETTTSSTTCSGRAEASTTMALTPPVSAISVAIGPGRAASAALMRRAVPSEPVKATPAIRGSATSGAPKASPSPTAHDSTSAGMPAGPILPETLPAAPTST